MAKMGCTAGPDQYGKWFSRQQAYGGKPLTVRETQVLQYTANDLSCKEIASILHRTYDTVRCYQEKIKMKLRKSSAAGCVAEGIRRGIISVLAILVLSPKSDAQCNKCIPYVEVLFTAGISQDAILSQLKACRAKGFLINGNMVEVYVSNGAQGHVVERRLRNRYGVQFVKLLHRRAVETKVNGKLGDLKWDWHNPDEDKATKRDMRTWD